MKRRSFLPIPFIASVAGVSLASVAIGKAKESPRKSALVRAGKDRSDKPFTFLDAEFTVKVSEQDTEGRCVVFDTIRHAKVGPQLHIHTNCDEWFWVMSGEFKFQSGDDIMRLKAGDSLLVPQGVQHAFVKVSEGDARLVIMHQPAVGMETYFREALLLPDQTPEGRRSLAEKHGMRFVGPPLRPD